MSGAWKQAGIILGVIGGALGVSNYVLPPTLRVLRSDPPPFANVARVDDLRKTVHDAKNEIRADLMYSRVFNLRVTQCQAIKAKNFGLSQSIAEQISEAERVYMQITGVTVMIQPCSDL